jgi:pSer/pThr/pTyr-binding forkhead associated (FHA) protein
VRLKLVVIGGSHSGKEIQVSGPKFFIGRDRDCQLRPNSDVVSRHHCALIVEEGYVAVRDFNSKNGTLVDGVRVIGEQELRSGSELSVGPLRFLVQLDVAVGGGKRPPVQSVEEAAKRTAQLARGGEDNIDDWLDESDPSGSDTGLVSIKGATQRRTDTSHAINKSKKTTINDGEITDSKILAAKNIDADHSKAEEAESQHAHKNPGKLPRVDASKEKPVDTQTAVRDALRKLRLKKQKKD